jgi:hypothetical protein
MATRSSHPLLSCTDGVAADWADFVQLVGRILLGQLFILIGWTKLTGYAFYVSYFTALKVPYPDIWPWPIGILELVIGVALIVGFVCRHRHGISAPLLGIPCGTAIRPVQQLRQESRDYGWIFIHIPDGRRTFRNRRIAGKTKIGTGVAGSATEAGPGESFSRVEHTTRWTPLRVRFGSKADMCGTKHHVRYVPKADTTAGPQRNTINPISFLFPDRLWSAQP